MIDLMGIIDSFIEFLEMEVIYSLPFLLMTLYLGQKLFPKEINIKKSTVSISWIILFFTFLNLCLFLFGMTYWDDYLPFLKRATGPYAFSYLLMIFGSLLFPFCLLKKSFAQKTIFVLITSIFMKTGWYMEKIVWLSSNLHRDFVPEGSAMDTTFLENYMGIIVKGIIAGIFWLIVLYAKGSQLNSEKSSQINRPS